MKPTTAEITNAAFQYVESLTSDEGLPRHVVDDFTQGAEWAISQMQPEWVACKYQDDIPNGWYSFLLETGGIKKEDFVNVTTGKVPYYFATHYCKIDLPQPPTDKP